MRVEPATPGAICYDSLQFSESGTAAQAAAFKANGAKGVYGYLGVINQTRVSYILDAGLAFLSVGLAGRFEGPTMVQQLKGLSAPPGLTTCMDLEGLEAFHADPVAYAAKINAGADVLNVNFISALYVGSPQPFTSKELWELHVKGYWRGQGRIVDRFGPLSLAEPTNCGWWAYQAYPSIVVGGDVGGVLVDVDMISQDYLGRVPTWMVG